jgi:RNA polymerase sigma factor (sigma-70 family)
MEASDPGSLDADLVQRCLAGQTDAFRDLYRRHEGRVRGTLHQLCDSDALDDLVQEVFFKAWKGLPRFRQSAQFSTWLYRIAWNVAIDSRRRQGRARSHLQGLQSLALAEVAGTASDLSDLHYQDLVQRGLQELSLEHRAVLVLHDLEELPQKEVAIILTIPLGTVKSRLYNARTALRRFLQREGVNL